MPTKIRNDENTMTVAVDAIHSEKEKLTEAGGTLGSIAAQAGLKRQFVSIVSPESYLMPFQFAEDWFDQIKAHGASRLEELTKDLRVAGDGPNRVVLQPERSGAQSVRALGEFARAASASLLAVILRAEKKDRFFPIGGFTGALLMTSPVPVLAVNAEAPRREGVSRIVFATDFSEGSEDAFDRTLELAETLECEVLIFHHLLPYIDPGIAAAGTPFVASLPAIETYAEDQEKTANRNADQWRLKAQRRGVKAEVLVKRGSASTAELILKAADRSKDAVAVMTQSGRFAALVIGSVARAVIAKAQCPVLIFNPVNSTKESDHVGTKRKVVAKRDELGTANRPRV